MEKDARARAERLFVEAKGKISNVDVAKKVGAHPITVGKWKRQDEWTAKLAAEQAKPSQKRAAPPVRKKTAHQDAFNMFVKAGGKISNKAIADQVGVSATTISNWKAAEDWTAKLKSAAAPARAVPEKKAARPKEEAPVAVAPVAEVAIIEEIEIDVDKLAAPDHITVLNQQIEDILAKGHLSPLDLKIMAEAKEAALRAVMAYLDVMDRTAEE